MRMRMKLTYPTPPTHPTKTSNSNWQRPNISLHYTSLPFPLTQPSPPPSTNSTPYPHNTYSTPSSHAPFFESLLRAVINRSYASSNRSAPIFRSYCCWTTCSRSSALGFVLCRSTVAWLRWRWWLVDGVDDDGDDDGVDDDGVDDDDDDGVK